MRGYIELERPSHCIACWLRNDDDNCVVQRDDENEFIEYDSWEQQMAMCPIQDKAKIIEEFIQRMDIMAGTGNGIGKTTVEKIKRFAEQEGYIKSGR